MCSRNCSIEKCTNHPLLACDCEVVPVLLCDKHIKTHSLLSRNHSYTKVFSEIQEKSRKSVIKLFSKIKPELKKLRSSIIQEELSIIKKVHNVAENALKELKKYEANFNQIMLEISSLKVIDYSKPLTFIESLLKQHPRNIEKNKKIRAPQLTIQSINEKSFSEIFKTLEPITECFDYRKNYYDNSRIIKLVWENTSSPVLGVFDAELLKVYQHDLKWEHFMGKHEIKCLLPDGYFLYSLGEDLFIYDPMSNIKRIPYYDSPIGTAIYVGGCIFACFHPLCWSKYNIQKNKWSPLASVPKSQGFCKVSALFRNYILLGSSHSKTVIFYDMIVNSFSEISSRKLELEAKKNKTIVVHDKRVFIIEFSHFIYESTDILMTWNRIGKCAKLELELEIQSWPIFYKENIYISSKKGIYALNIRKTKTRKVVSL